MDRALEPADARGSLCVTRGPQGHLLSPLRTASDTYSLSPRAAASSAPLSTPPILILVLLERQRQRQPRLLLTPLLSLSPRRVISFRSCKPGAGGTRRTRWHGGTSGRKDVSGAGRGDPLRGVTKGGRAGEPRNGAEEPRREATGSRESSYGTEGYMAVYYVLESRVTYAFVPSPCTRGEQVCVSSSTLDGSPVPRVLVRSRDDVGEGVRAEARFARNSLTSSHRRCGEHGITRLA